MKHIVPDDKIKEIALDGLKYLKQVCEERDIQYFLAYGTLIGAVRHQGFIPWDDDIDVWVPRKSYNQLISLSDQIETDQWKLISHENESRYLFPWAKLCNRSTVIAPSRFENGFLYGLSIDVFPLDDCPDNITNIESALEYSNKLYSNLTSTIHTYSPYTGGLRGIENGPSIIKKKIKYVIRKGGSQFPLKMEQIGDAASRTFEPSKFVHSILSLDNTAYPKEAFQEHVMCPFEGVQFAIPKGYDELLRIYYGDYMELPPVEKRVSNHTFDAYYK